MAKNKTVRVCQRHWIEKEDATLDYKLIGISWHTTVEAAKRYYSEYHETQKKDLAVCDQAVAVGYSPLYPRLAKKS